VIFWHIGLTMVIVWFVMRGNKRVDYRLVALGSLLPEIGRRYTHALLVNVAFLCVAFFLRGRIKRQFVLVPISSLLHLAEDGIWSNPRVFWWPLFGNKAHFALPSFRAIVIEELVGLVLLVWLLGTHGRLSAYGLRDFIKTGRLE